MVAHSDPVRGMKMEMQWAALMAVELEGLMAEKKGVHLAASLAASLAAWKVDGSAFQTVGGLAGDSAVLTAAVKAVA